MRAWVSIVGFGLLALGLAACGGGDSCKPDCLGLACGHDGCGGFCGQCDDPALPVCEAGACVAAPPACASDADCVNPALPICENGECVAAPPECLSDADCVNPALPRCENGVCVAAPPECASDADCVNPALPRCENGECVAAPPECASDADCVNSALPVCENGVCVAAPPECLVDGDCLEVSAVCLDGSCCTPACAGLCCGDDGCGGQCPDACAADQVCVSDTCLCQDAPPGGPSRYPHDALLSPISAPVVAAMSAIAAWDADLADDVFMKVGASGTVSTHFLHCLAGADVDLGARGDLQASLDYFLAGDAGGTNPYQRESLAAEVGRTAAWALAGAPAPVDQEASALGPRFAFVNYGTNDMGWFGYNVDTLYWFYENMDALLDHLSAAGIIPLVTGLNPRADSAEARRWVRTYNAVSRGLAEARQLPYLDLYLAVVDLPDMGLVADGIHGNAYNDGTGYKPCLFTAAGLQYNYNQRNLLSLDLLDRVKRALLDGGPGEAEALPPLAGQGTAAEPFVIDGLPFSHAHDTTLSPQSDFDAYPACDQGQDESGPEVIYRLELGQTQALRLIVLDLAEVDVDLHLLGADPTAASCLARGDKEIAITLGPGTHHLSVDSWVSAGGTPYPGAYLLVVVPCDDDDGACQ